MAHAVALILYNDKKELLLQLRDEYTQKNPNKWGFFGGAIDKGELPEQAIRREVREELSYIARHPQLVLTEHISGDGTKYLFTEQFDTTQTLRLGEGKAMQWFSIEQTKMLDMVVSHRERLAKFLASEENPFGGPKGQ